jgi:hypothetical protein
MEAMDRIASHSPTAFVFMYQTPLRHANYTQFVDNHRWRNITYIGTDGNGDELEYMIRKYIDGLVGELTYDMGAYSVDTLYKIVTEGADSVPKIRHTKLVNYNLVPEELPFHEVEDNLVSDELAYVGYTCFTIVAISSIICMSWTICHRKGIVVRASQPFFLIMTATGILIMGSALIPLSMDDSGEYFYPGILESYAIGICMSPPWLAFVGFTVTFSALFAKTRRIVMFFRSTSQYGRIQVSEMDVMAPFAGMMVLNVAILTTWTVVDPLTYIRQYDDGTDLWNRELSSTGSCQSENGALPYLVSLAVGMYHIFATFFFLQTRLCRKLCKSVSFCLLLSISVLLRATTCPPHPHSSTHRFFEWTLLFFSLPPRPLFFQHTPIVNFCVVLLACWQAYEARGIKSEFAEAEWIGWAILSMCQAFLTGIPVIAVVRTIPQAFFLTVTFVLFIVCMVVLWLIFFPKMLIQKRYASMSPQEQKRAMAVSVRLSSGRSAHFQKDGSGSGVVDQSGAFRSGSSIPEWSKQLVGLTDPSGKSNNKNNDKENDMGENVGIVMDGTREGRRMVNDTDPGSRSDTIVMATRNEMGKEGGSMKNKSDSVDRQCTTMSQDSESGSTALTSSMTTTRSTPTAKDRGEDDLPPIGAAISRTNDNADHNDNEGGTFKYSSYIDPDQEMDDDNDAHKANGNDKVTFHA